jgi:hypothetical protein
LRAGEPGIAQRGAFRCPTQHSIRSPSREKCRRALAAVGAWLQALDYTGFDYTLDRTERLERELAQLKEELRQSGEASSNDPLQCRRHLKAEEESGATAGNVVSGNRHSLVDSA